MEFIATLVGVLAAAVTIGPDASRETVLPSVPAVTLAILDRAGVPPSVWTDAERVVTTIYRKAGVRTALSWNAFDDPANDRAGDITILLLSGPASRATATSFGLAADVLAFVPGTADNRARLAYVFEDRIAEQSSQSGVSLGVLLGRVIAHEVGHVLLPFHSHSGTGIMRPGIDTASARLEFFTSDQAANMRERLSAQLFWTRIATSFRAVPAALVAVSSIR